MPGEPPSCCCLILARSSASQSFAASTEERSNGTGIFKGGMPSAESSGGQISIGKYTSRCKAQTPNFRSDRFVAGFTGANPQGVDEVVNEDFAVADLAGLSSLHNGG